MELMPRRTSRVLYALRIMVLFLLVISGIFVLYFYLWQTLTVVVAKSVAKDFYIAATTASCSSNADCAIACKKGDPLKANEACMCLHSVCYYIPKAEHFSQHKFCQHDNDCIVSCYEGAVSRAYYESAGGQAHDCTEGCARGSITQSDDPAGPLVCRSNQCQYRSGATCFVSEMPKRS